MHQRGIQLRNLNRCRLAKPAVLRQASEAICVTFHDLFAVEISLVSTHWPVPEPLKLRLTRFSNVKTMHRTGILSTQSGQTKLG